jgi:hypothetical protein
MSQVTPLRLLDWVVIQVDDFVQISHNNLCDFVQLDKIVFAASSVNEGGQSKRS